MSLADHATAIAENLSLTGDNSGELFKPAAFQKKILRTLFATDRKGNRRVNRCLLFLPRKQAKTYLAACVVVIWLFGLKKTGQQILSVANDRQQAGLLFEMVKQIIESNPALLKRCDIRKSQKRIIVEETYSYYQALSSESTNKTGYSPSLVIIDEAQDITDADLIKNVTTGFGARTDYLTLMIGTAGTRKDTPFYAEYEYAKRFLSREIVNPNYAAFIYEAPENADWTDRKVWKRAMPALGTFCSRKVIEDDFALAQEMPHKESEFRQYYLNQWQTNEGTQWIRHEDWARNNTRPLGDSTEYTAGLDIASVVDTSSLVLFGKNSAGSYDVIPFIWVCQEQVAKRKSAEFDYKRWQEQGFLRVTKGNAQDQEQILADLLDVFRTYKVSKLAIDRYGTQWFGPKLLEHGIPAFEMGQGTVSMSEPLKQLQRLVLNRQLAHGGHPVMAWMASNCRVVCDASENYRITKADRERKVDGIQALAMAIGAYVFAPEPTIDLSIYQDREALFALMGVREPAKTG